MEEPSLLDFFNVLRANLLRNLQPKEPPRAKEL